MKKLWKNNHADMNMIISAVIIVIMLAIGVVIIFNIFAAIDTSTIDATIKGGKITNLGDGQDAYNVSWNNTHPAGNATTNLQNNVETFFTVAPIIVIVMAAVGILAYVMLLRRQG